MPRHGDAADGRGARAGRREPVCERLRAQLGDDRRPSLDTRVDGVLPTRLGWRGFDPTTGKAIGIQHIAAGVSQHPRGVMPVTGSFVGARHLFRSLEVDVQTREIDPVVEGEDA